MRVFAFDRDWTVDVNPHPCGQSVPLEWVRHFAHETEHAVYAIRNQTIAEEAAIPGIVDIVGRHADAWDEWLGGKEPDGYYERFPTRRERLSPVADMHPDADGYVVVNDIDLSNVDGWKHYHAWDFVPAVERGGVNPALPWTRDPVADGGLPTVAGVVPAGVPQRTTLLDDPDTPGNGGASRHATDGKAAVETRTQQQSTRAGRSRSEWRLSQIIAEGDTE